MSTSSTEANADDRDEDTDAWQEADQELDPPTHLAYAVIATVLFWPLGAVAVSRAARVDRLFRGGRFEEAWKVSQSAHTWAEAAVAVFMVGVIAGALLIGFVGWQLAHGLHGL